MEEDDITVFPQFERALVGYGQHHATPVAIYSYPKCVTILVADGMDRDEAIEWMEFNVVGSWVGPGTPVFLTHDPDNNLLEDQ